MTLAVAAVAAMAAMTGCSRVTGSLPGGQHTIVSQPALKASPCRQAYENWKHGPARSALSALMAALAKVSAAGAAQDIPLLRTALSQMSAAAGSAAAHPIPQCADPRAYYEDFIARIQAAGDYAKTASGLTGILLALVPLKAVPAIGRSLTAELRRTVGEHGSPTQF